MTANHCLQKWKWWLTLVWPLLWGQMCLCDNFSLALCLAFQNVENSKNVKSRRLHNKLKHISLCWPWRDTSAPFFCGGELARPQSWRDLASRTKKAEEGKRVPRKTSVGADPEMSTLWGNVAGRLWPIAQGHHSDASSSTDPYDEKEEKREPLTSVSLEGIQLKGIVQASKQRTNTRSDSMQWRWAVTLLTPFCIFFFAGNFGQTPRGAKVKHTGLIMNRIVFSSTVCFCLQLNNPVLVDVTLKNKIKQLLCLDFFFK